MVGSAIVRHLVASGETPRCLSRTGTADAVFDELGATPVRGDVLDRAALSAAFEGAEIVYHVAGVNTMCPLDPAPMLRVNVEGSRNVVAAAEAAGVRRVVYTSSAAAIGESQGEVGTESSPHRGWYLSHYERSKHLAEQAVFEAAERVELVVVNPSSVQGPGRATGTGALILALLRGKLPALIDTRLSIVDIDDCAQGHLLAASHGKPGERYLLNSFTMTMREAVSMLETAVGRPVRVRWVPAWVASLGVGPVEVVARLRGVKPAFCREMVRTIRHGHSYDGSKAAVELGVAYTSAPVLLSRLVDWFSSEGML